eukprot:TRINITY_DN16003_c0_g1_i1.p1 TRINITY_DN16003_c0_g1~~TRINITY_DN16003_c0_g1_i1.p1  ORF type:complete len:468 (+),score=45.68 TRINITY_DN16003_c0_g1_i1:38-1441(+)
MLQEEDHEGCSNVFCCRFHPRQYKHGRGALANKVIRETRGCFCNESNENDSWSEGWIAKFFYSIFDLSLDLYAAFAVMAKYVITPETLLAATTAVTSVLIYDRYGGHLSSDMSWTLVSFAVVFPLTMSITQAFVRRDSALESLATIRAVTTNMLMAHCRWNWVGSKKSYEGRKMPTTVRPVDDPSTAAWELEGDHVQNVHKTLDSLIDAIRTYLLVPRRGRARHVYTAFGRREDAWVGWAEEVGAEKVTKIISRLHSATETLKSYGLPPNEASRISQYLYFLTREWETVRTLKEYRTPQAMRSFSRVMVHTLPMFYGPYFLHFSKGDDGVKNVYFACIFAGLISVFMCALLLVQTSLENPFDTKSLDTVKVDYEMGRTRRLFVSIIEDYRDTPDWSDEPPAVSITNPKHIKSAYVPPAKWVMGKKNKSCKKPTECSEGSGRTGATATAELVQPGYQNGPDLDNQCKV